MNPVVLTLRADGSCTCFYTEAIDLAELGKLEVKRATVIEFNNEAQLWEVVDGYGEILFQHASRAACLSWEQRSLSYVDEKMALNSGPLQVSTISTKTPSLSSAIPFR